MRKSRVSSEESDSDGQDSISGSLKSKSSTNETEPGYSENESSKHSSDSESDTQEEDEYLPEAKKSSPVKSDTKENTEKIKNKSKQSKKSIRKITKEEHVLGVQILQTSTLKFDKHIRAPRVRISFYDQTSGKLLSKSRADKNVIFNQEPDSLDFILPIISAEGQMNDEFSFSWNEVIIINDDLEHLKNFLMFLEIIDVAREPGKSSNNKKVHNGWYHICWAFMQLTSKRQPQFDVKTSLQLFKYKKASKNYTVYKQWTLPAWKKYPATLAIKLISLLPKPDNVGLTRPFTALQIDRKVSWSSNNNFTQINEFRENFTLPNWTKVRQIIPRKSFEPPKNVAFETQTCGSTVCCFSPDGKYVAYADNIVKGPAVVVRYCSNLHLCLNLRGHTDMIHSLYWWNDEEDSSRNLISTSQDKSCIVWQIEESSYKMKNVLPHPCFLYCAIFAQSLNKRNAQIVTGGRDGILYVWSILPNTPRILEELCNHNSYIVGIGYSNSLGTLYSAEVNGIVIEWKYNEDTQSWTTKRKFDLKNTIKQFTLHSLMSNNIYILLERALIKMDAKSGSQLKILSNQIVSLNATKFTITQNGAYVFLVSNLNILGFHQFSEKIICSIRLKRNHDGIINFIHLQSHQNLLAVSTQSKLYGGGFYVYAPEEQEKTTTKILTKQNDSTKIPNLENTSFNDILMKLERILKIKKLAPPERAKADEDERVEEMPKHNQSTYSIKANRTFVVPGVANRRHQRKEDDDGAGHTFTINLGSNSSDTDVSEDLPISAEERSVSSHNTNRTITICKEAN